MKKLTPLLLSLVFSFGAALPAMAQGYNPVEMGTFENYLNAHPNTARELQQNPNLINDPQWMGHHQGLEEYMAAHPNVRAEVHSNPGGFINNGGQWSWNHANGSAAARFDQGYLNEHPEVSDQLARNPGLADNPQYLAAHPGLNDYLQAHPNVHYDLEHHPDRFMSRADGGAYPRAPESAAARFDQGYLNEHPEVSNQLARNPGLADNPQYLAAHPGLNDYLQAHPNVRYDIDHHPDRFMSKADQGAPGYHGYGYQGNPVWNGEHHEMGTADSYFNHHPDVYHEMEQDPRLVDNQHYVDSHPGLHDYLEDHPRARQTFKNHPDAFMHAEEHYQQHHNH
jgi:hypothetical protein